MIRHGHAALQSLDLDRSCSDEAPPIELLHKVRRQIARRGEVKLALAVLEDAVGCLEGSQDPWNFPPRLFRWEAERWIESRDREPLFSFERICSILHLDAESVRAQIRRWRAHRSSERNGRLILVPRGGMRKPVRTKRRFGRRRGSCRADGALEGGFIQIND